MTWLNRFDDPNPLRITDLDRWEDPKAGEIPVSAYAAYMLMLDFCEITTKVRAIPEKRIVLPRVA